MRARCAVDCAPVSAYRSNNRAEASVPRKPELRLHRPRAERERPRTAQSFCVPKGEIVAASYDLSINRYKEVEQETSVHRPPKEIIAELKKLEKEIAEGLDELENFL